jgi:hypothetical protein
MKNFRDYLSESEQAAENPVTGHVFAVNIREECLVESVVLEHAEDGIVIAADEKMLKIFESYGISLEDTCMECGVAESDCGCNEAEHVDEIAPVIGAVARMAVPAAIGAAMSSDDNANEARDPGEYDTEGDMAKNELHTIIRAARKLTGMLDNDDNMPEWTQKKINKAADYVDTAADYISSQKERGVMEQHEDSPVARAVLHRIMMAHPSVLATHGPERVMSAVDELADRVNIGPDDEIGTSDVSGWVRDVIRMLAELPDESMSDVDRLGEQDMSEAEYQGRKVQLGKPTRGDVKKFKVYVKDPKTGNVKKVNFGDPNMKIKKSNPARRKSFRARHNCDNPGPRTKARYWSCRKW